MIPMENLLHISNRLFRSSNRDRFQSIFEKAGYAGGRSQLLDGSDVAGSSLHFLFCLMAIVITIVTIKIWGKSNSHLGLVMDLSSGMQKGSNKALFRPIKKHKISMEC